MYHCMVHAYVFHTWHTDKMVPFLLFITACQMVMFLPVMVASCFKVPELCSFLAFRLLNVEKIKIKRGKKCHRQ